MPRLRRTFLGVLSPQSHEKGRRHRWGHGLHSLLGDGRAGPRSEPDTRVRLLLCSGCWDSGPQPPRQQASAHGRGRGWHLPRPPSWRAEPVPPRVLPWPSLCACPCPARPFLQGHRSQISTTPLTPFYVTSLLRGHTSPRRRLVGPSFHTGALRHATSSTKCLYRSPSSAWSPWTCLTSLSLPPFFVFASEGRWGLALRSRAGHRRQQ